VFVALVPIQTFSFAGNVTYLHTDVPISPTGFSPLLMNHWALSLPETLPKTLLNPVPADDPVYFVLITLPISNNDRVFSS